jgi:hypothetical protein
VNRRDRDADDEQQACGPVPGRGIARRRRRRRDLIPKRQIALGLAENIVEPNEAGVADPLAGDEEDER